MSPSVGHFAQAVATLTLPLSLLAQAPSSGLSGVQGGQGGTFTIPYVAAHTLGIPGVTRPMLMAGPVGGLGGVGGGGGGGGAMVNPNWVGAAGMFMPHLLNGNATGGGGASGGTANGGRTFGANHSIGAVHGQQLASAANLPQAGGAPSLDASAARGPSPMVARRVAVVHAPPVDPALVEERLLTYQKEQAAKGSPSAQLALARRYSKGQGVEANPAVARVWLEAAARSGSEEAKAELESK